MIDAKLLEVLNTPPDCAVAIVTQGQNSPHVVNTWNSYVVVTDDGKLLIPAGRMTQTEKNLKVNNAVWLTISNREVMGKAYKGTGFLVKGTACFVTDGIDFDVVKAKFPWARAALIITVKSTEQTL